MSGVLGSPHLGLTWQLVLLQRRGSVQSTTSRFNMSMEQHQRDDVDLALWLAANRPTRPDSWAWVEGEEAKEPLLGHGRPQALFTGAQFEQRTSSQQHKNEAAERQGWGVNAQPVEGGQRAQVAAVRPEPTQHDAVIDLNNDTRAGSLEILPDVPGGLESVDQLATHISLWPATSAAESSSAFAPRNPTIPPSFLHH